MPPTDATEQTEPTMTDKPDGKRLGWTAALWTCVAAIAFYVLSIGPMLRLTRPHPLAPRNASVHAAYSPLFQLSRLEVVGNGLAWYITLWGTGAYYDGPREGVLIDKLPVK
jgi:hypothetical protein